jgi:hypothetical protein
MFDLDHDACFGRLEQWRAIATRYGKYAATYLGGVPCAARPTHDAGDALRGHRGLPHGENRFQIKIKCAGRIVEVAESTADADLHFVVEARHEKDRVHEPVAGQLPEQQNPDLALVDGLHDPLPVGTLIAFPNRLAETRRPPGGRQCARSARLAATTRACRAEPRRRPSRARFDAKFSELSVNKSSPASGNAFS